MKTFATAVSGVDGHSTLVTVHTLLGGLRGAALALLVIGSLLSGCAIQNERGFNLDIDQAALFGRDIASFRLQDGSSATVRAQGRQGGGSQYSIKLEKHLKVVNLGVAESMRFVRAEQIDNRTVAVLTRLERDCTKTLLITIKDADVAYWTVKYGDCRKVPELSVDGDKFYLSYPGVRFVYRAGEVTKELATTVTAGAAAAPTSSVKSEPVQPPPAPKLGSNAGVVTDDGAAPAARPAARAPSAPAPKPLDFPAKEKKPVRIILD